MRAEYDSEANALSIDLVEVGRWDRSEPVDDNYCVVSFHDEVAANVELIDPERNLSLLARAAAEHGLDAEALEAAARSALAAPDRAVVLEVSAPT